MNTLINFDFQMPVRIHQRLHARLNRKNSEKRKQTVSVNSQNLRKCALKIDLLTEVLYELVKMFFARIQLTGGPDKHSMSQSISYPESSGSLVSGLVARRDSGEMEFFPLKSGVPVVVRRLSFIKTEVDVSREVGKLEESLDGNQKS